jgi:hypothetical protein
MRMVQKVRWAGSSTMTDTRTERQGSGFGIAVTEGRAGLGMFLEPARSCSFFVWPSAGHDEEHSEEVQCVCNENIVFFWRCC